MKDGLYLVQTRKLTAGFVVSDGKVVSCAPILRAHFDYWKRKAKWVAE